jgi:hypothetical protein
VRYDDFVPRTVPLLLVLLGTAAAAYSPTLDQRAIDDAVAIGQSYSDAVRERFHLAYRVHVAKAPVDYIEVITPFRRLVLTAEDRARIGERYLSQREVRDILASQAEAIELVAELTFHPLNTYVGVPDYVVTLEAGPQLLRPRSLERFSRFTPRVAGVPAAGAGATQGSQPLLGGTLVARFDRTDLNPFGVYDAVISEAGKELGRGRVELGTLR